MKLQVYVIIISLFLLPLTQKLSASDVVKTGLGEDWQAYNVPASPATTVTAEIPVNRKSLIDSTMDWNAKYILTGMEAGGKNVWRITPDLSVPDMTIENFLHSDKNKYIKFKIGDQIIKFPEGSSIYKPERENSSLGYWVISPINTRPKESIYGNDDDESVCCGVIEKEDKEKDHDKKVDFSCKIYPNPANENVTISVVRNDNLDAQSGEPGNTRIQILSSFNPMVFFDKKIQFGSEVSYSTANLNEGVYIVRISADDKKVFEANARFARAAQYAKLIFLYGDVPYYTTILDIDEAFALSRTSKETISDAVYEDFDFAIQNLPETYGAGEYNYATKGAALAMKARTALYMGDYALARDAAKACMDLGIYSLYPNYHELFLSSTKNSIETVFGTPRSVELGIVIPGSGRVKEPLPRIVGGFANGGPSWDLLCSYLCTDGLPIDESPLFNPHEPFKNRDPRCTATIVEFGTPWLGFIYQPHPDTLRVMNLNSGQLVSNTDNRAVGQYASFNGLVWKKKIDEDWLDLQTDPDNIVMRYADVLLMYAEAKIELGEVDQSVLDAMNTVRARAYGAGINETTLYPALTTLDQAQLRKILRVERRMEFAFEGTRYHDLIRWELAEKALNNHPIYGMLDPADLRTKLISNGLWFFPSTPQIDDDGLVDFSEMFNAGQIKLLAERTFDVSKQYFWPIPSSEIEINPNMDQNTGY